MELSKKMKKIMLFALVFAFLAMVTTSYLFYRATIDADCGFILGMALQNTFEGLLFNPMLAIADMYVENVFPLNYEHNIIIAIYSVAMVITPMIECVIALSILDKVFNILIEIRPFSKKILVVGYNDNTRKLLKTKVKRHKIYLCTDALLSDEEQKELASNKVIIESESIISNKFVKRKKIETIILVDSSDAKNIQRYIEMVNFDICKKKTIHFYVHCKEFDNYRMLQKFFNEKLPKGDDDISYYDLRIFNYEQIQTERIFEKLPLHTVNTEEKKNVHLLVVGAGLFGEIVALQAINQGVLSADNEIIIDIIDDNVDVLRKRLDRRFDKDYFKHDGATDTFYIIGENKADGSVKIRLKSMDVTGDFHSDLDNFAEKPYTYVAICNEDADINWHCMNEFEKAKCWDGEIPFAIKALDTQALVGYFKDKKYCLDIFIIGNDACDMSVAQLINADMEDRIQKYDNVYNAICDKLVYNKNNTDIMPAEKKWNKLVYYKRNNNRGLYYHRSVKKAFWSNYKQELETFNKALEGKNSDKMDLMKSEELINGKYPYLVAAAKTEHRRFNYFLASEGWGYNADAKIEGEFLHNCLCDWDTLVGKNKNMLIYDIIAFLIELQ